MSEIINRIADLSPEKKALLTMRLKKLKSKRAGEPVIQRREDLSSYPLSYAQQRMWFLSQWDPESPFYNISTAVQILGEVNINVLQASLQAVIDRHEVLKARFTTVKGLPIQTIDENFRIHISLVDISHLDKSEKETQIDRIAKEEAQKPFDLSIGPLIRCSLTKIEPEEYIFFLTIHHIISDGWSINILIKEVLEFYEATLNNREANLPVLPIQYADYSVWQRKLLEGKYLEDQVKYWKEKLRGYSQILELPTDRQRPTVMTSKGLHKSFSLSKRLSQELIKLSQQEDVTLFMTLLASFQVLLYRYSGQEDICIGTPIANRNQSEIENLIGFFVNTLVIRCDLSENNTFRQLLQQVKTVALDAFSHQDLPFDMLVNEMQPERSMSHTPLFQVMFDLQTNPIRNIEVQNLKLKFLELESGTAKFDLMLMMVLDKEAIRGTFEYNTDLFDDTTIESMIEHFLELVKGIIENPDCPISILPFLTEKEKYQILNEWDYTKETEEPKQCIHRLFEQQVVKTPHTLAAVYADPTNNRDVIQSLTYEELNYRANQVAYWLIDRGLEPNMMVGLCLERSTDILIGIMGILKAGGAYLPLDPYYPEERLKFILDDSNIRFLITQTPLVDKLPFSGGNLLCIDDTNALSAYNSKAKINPIINVDPSNLAYVIYTSGSTGRPKGVMIEHRSAINLWQGLNDLIYQKFAGQRLNVSLNAPILFDASVQQWLMLLSGHTIYIIPQDVRLDGVSLLRYIQDYQIDVLDCVPTQLKLLIGAGLFDRKGWIPKAILPGGEAIDPATWESLVSNDYIKFFNMYGPTECTVDATICPVNDYPNKPSIGKPINNNYCYILDRNMQPVPVGVLGELFIGGRGVGRGYLNRPELNAQKFISNPFRDSSRLYRTGDLVRWLPDGNIEFLGRMDYQVKIRGFRIELGEIESILIHYPSVKEAVILAREDTPGDKRLVAYVVLEPESNVNVEDLRNELKNKLPDYMIPSAIMILQSFPLTPNGKLDRKALPIPDKSRMVESGLFVAPSTALEKYLAKKWQEILGIEKVGIYDNFFELGGDSIKAAIFINNFQEELGVTTHVRSIFMAPTIAELAIYITEYYPDAYKKISGEVAPIEVTSMVEDEITSPAVKRVDERMIRQIRQIIRPLKDRQASLLLKEKNPKAVFVLSPPRSGSTLLRAMLAGHPRLFSPPELDLLSFNTLSERKATFSGKHAFWLEGVIRAIMDIKSCSADEAQALMGELEEKGLSTQMFYRMMQEWLGDRILVDKTPVYSLDMNILKRAEEDFEQPYYIHLVRHPYASIYSFIEAKLDQVFFRYDHPFSQRELAELVWVVSHENILKFLETIPDHRKLLIKFEDLVSKPEEAMHQICNLLGLEFTPLMVKPYEGKRMTDGVRPGTQMVGDFKFYLRKDIDPNAADRWKKFQMDDFLGTKSWEIASKLGYEEPQTVTLRVKEAKVEQIPIIPRDGELPLSYAQQRLWFFDQWEPGSPFYNIPSALRLLGRVNIAAVERSLNEIVQRHEILRTSFHTVNGKPVIKIAENLSIPLPLIDLQDLPDDKKEDEARRLAAEEARKPFDLSVDPLIRACIIRLTKEDHIFLLTMHHIVSDGWSIGILIREFSQLYPSCASGKVINLPPLPIQYVDYAAWQQAWLKGEVVQKQMDYWRNTLKGAHPILELPFDRPRPPVQTFNGARRDFEISAPIAAKVRSLSRQEGVTLFMTLLAAFDVLLYRYSSQEVINIGTPIANRQRAELENLIGFFVNTLVLQINLTGNPSFRELLKRVLNVSLEAYDHQDVPFERLVDELNPERAMSHTPLFQVMFTLQDTPITTVEMPELIIQPIQSDSGTAKFDLALTVIEKGNVLKTSWEFNTDLFNSETIERMAMHYQVLLEGIVQNPQLEIGKLPILTLDEEELIVKQWNATEYAFDENLIIHQIFEDQVDRNPDSIALYYEGVELTYKELDEKANQLAHFLNEVGVKRDSIVGLLLKRGINFIVGMFAIWKAGGAYLPLDPAYPKERLQYMMLDSKALEPGLKLVLTSHSMDEQFTELGIELVDMDKKAGELAKYSRERLNLEVKKNDLAYIIYTSGSTGKPKGTMLEHHGLTNFVLDLQKRLRVGPGKKFLQFSSISFDASILEIGSILTSGGCLVLAKEETLHSIDDLHELFRKQKITHTLLPPTVLRIFPNKGLDDLEVMITGGEACTVEIARNWSKGRYMLNAYGPTETTVAPLFYPVIEIADNEERIPIGRPISNTYAYVLDKYLNAVPIGVVGEICIGGIGLMRGYANQKELTNEKLIDNPYKPGERLYRTGDLGKYRVDGNIDFMGRIDDQVKVRGFRIELKEIERVIESNPEINQAVVIVREDRPGVKQLVAYIQLREGSNLQTHELRLFLKNIIPEYMVPSIFIFLKEFPLMANGKIDRQALPKPDISILDTGKAFVEPKTEKERIIAKIWAEVLGLEKVSITDNFFELGGDSILTIQVISRVNQAGLKITPRQLFEAQTVSELAYLAEATQNNTIIEAEQGLLSGPVGFTPIWKWFFEQNLPEPWYWNQALLLEVKANLNNTFLSECVRTILQHHDILRTQFIRNESGDWIANTVDTIENVPIEIIDLSRFPEIEQKRIVEEHNQEIQRSLDLQKGSLLKVVYYDFGPGRNGRLLVVLHHLVVDGVSWRILLEDFQSIYEQMQNSSVIHLPPKTTSYASWAKTLYDYAQSPALEQDIQFWEKSRIPHATYFPIDFPEGENSEASILSIKQVFDPEKTRLILREIPGIYRVDVPDILLAALFLAYTSWSGEEALQIDLEGHGRESDLLEGVDISRTIGWFTSIFPVTFIREHNRSFGDILYYVKEKLRQIPRKGISYGLLKYLRKNPELVDYQESPIVFNYLGQVIKSQGGRDLFSIAPESVGMVHSPKGKRAYILDISASIYDDKLFMEWQFSQNIHKRNSIEELVEKFNQVLEKIIQPEEEVSIKYTPSDFKDVQLSQEEIESMLDEISESDDSS